MSKENSKNKITLIIVCVLLVTLIGGGYWLYNKLGGGLAQGNIAVQEHVDTTATTSDSNDSSESDVKVPAEDFTVYDNDDEAVKLSDFKGKPVILNFWASWCGPCKSEMPDFEKAYAEYGDKIHFLMVNLTDGYQETKQKATSFIKDSGYTFPVYFDSDTDAAMKYGVTSIPATYFIDESGKFVAQGRGALEYEAIMQGVGMLID